MRDYSLKHLSDGALTNALRASVGTERAATAMLLAHLAEFDARQLYREAAHPSMRSYCELELHFSESAAYKRIQAARAARDFPILFEAVADGRMHLSGIVTLAPHLRPWNFEALFAASVHRSRAEIERVLAERFPKADLPESIRPLAAAASAPVASVACPETPSTTQLLELAPGRVGMTTPEQFEPSQPRQTPTLAIHATELASAPIATSAAAGTGTTGPAQRVTPLSAQRVGLQFTVDERVRQKLQHAQALLGHRPKSGELAHVFELALDLLIAQLERQKFAATTKPRRGRRGKSARHVPADVKRKVWARDGGQCTYRNDKGTRCPERKALEFDHVDPVARGGTATVSRVRLRCSAHNQYEAERAYGAAFMRYKREQAKRVPSAKASAAPVS